MEVFITLELDLDNSLLTPICSEKVNSKLRCASDFDQMCGSILTVHSKHFGNELLMRHAALLVGGSLTINASIMKYVPACTVRVAASDIEPPLCQLHIIGESEPRDLLQLPQRPARGRAEASNRFSEMLKSLQSMIDDRAVAAEEDWSR